jgi:GNAT superfamily N-acetyltransferase
MTELKFVKIDVVDQELSDDRYNFSVEYAKADCGRPFRPAVGDEIPVPTYKVLIDNKIVGFIELQMYNGAAGIENVYVKPEFRSLGYAKLIYKQAIEELDIHLMCISYHRVTKPKLLEYWNSIGFVAVSLVPGQTGSGLSLCNLLTDKSKVLDSPVTFALNRNGVKRCADHSRRISKKLSRYGGVERYELGSNANIVFQVLENHFGNKLKAA